MRTDWILPAAVAICLAAFLFSSFILSSVRDEFLRQGFDSLTSLRASQSRAIYARQNDLERMHPGIIASSATLSGILSNWSGRGETGESYIVASSGFVTKTWRFVTDSRFTDVTAVPSETIEGMTAVQAALTEGSGHKVVIDYRGVRVLSAYRQILLGGHLHILLVETDEAEILDHYYTLRLEIWVATGAAWVGIIGMAFILTWLIERGKKMQQEKDREIRALNKQLTAALQIVERGMSTEAAD